MEQAADERVPALQTWPLTASAARLQASTFEPATMDGPGALRVPARVDAFPRPQHLPDWALLPPPQPTLQVCVVMPVRDEARRLTATLRALAQQVDARGRPLRAGLFEVIVLANNCRDRSAQVVRRFARRHRRLALHVVEVQFPAAVAHVGQARSVLMDQACRRLRAAAAVQGTGGVDPADRIVVSTDGDTCVDRQWLAATLAEFAAGADAVGGRIVSRAEAGDAPALRVLVHRDDLYRRWRARLESLLDPDAADPWPRHHQHFGASLAVRVGAYEAVGGCPAVPWLEDEALVRALRRHDLRVRHSPQVRVLTSGRRQGRVQVGLSQQLSQWAEMAATDQEPQVPDPLHEAVQLRCRARLRAAWSQAQPADLGPLLREMAACLRLAPADVTAAWQAALYFGAFCGDVQAMAPDPAAPALPPAVGQRVALARLRALVLTEQQAARQSAWRGAQQALNKAQKADGAGAELPLAP